MSEESNCEFMCRGQEGRPTPVRGAKTAFYSRSPLNMPSFAICPPDLIKEPEVGRYVESQSGIDDRYDMRMRLTVVRCWERLARESQIVCLNRVVSEKLYFEGMMVYNGVCNSPHKVAESSQAVTY